MKKRIAILGSTGSIGRQTLDVVRQHPDLFQVEMITANNSADLLIQQAIEFDVNSVVICNKDKYETVCQALQPKMIKVFAGMESVCDLVAGDNIDIVVTAMVGFSGLAGTVAAIKAGKTIALANKETLVAAGQIVMQLAREYHAPILPVDSEHSAIFQCLRAWDGNKVEKIHLTASGGPFRQWKKEDIAKATRHEAMKHPNWSMGAKITIDSASMMNKGLEMIEAKWLFNVEPEIINIVVHPESIIHSMVEFIDGSVIAQLGNPDMREPIQYALGFPERLSLNNKKLDFATLGSISFFAPDFDRFPALSLAFEAIKRGGNCPCVMNGANEMAVAAFLKDRISFYQISQVVEKTMEAVDFIGNPSLDDIYCSNEAAIRTADSIIDKL